MVGIPKRFQEPKGIKREYTSFVLRYKDKLYDDFMKVVDRYLPQLEQFRLDASEEDFIASINVVLNILTNAAFGDIVFITGVNKAGKATTAFNTGKYSSRKGYQLLGINDLPVGKEATMLRRWTAENVRLIKGVTEDTVKSLEKTFYRAIFEGTPIGDVRKQITSLFMGDDYRYKLVTDDQIGKFNGLLDRVKQKDAGIDEYIWRTVGDANVRSQHQVREGNQYKWEDTSITHPGQEIRCRCYAEPYLGDIDLTKVEDIQVFGGFQ